jgi:hypothetical protein
MPSEKREKLIEWICRIFLTVHVWFVASGYITFLQTKHQLISPLIPKDLILQVTQPGFYTSSVLTVHSSFPSGYIFIGKEFW